MGRPRGSKNRKTLEREASEAKPRKASKANGAVPMKTRKGAGRDAPVVRAKYTKRLPVEVATEETAKLARLLAEEVEKRDLLLDEQRTSNAEFRERRAAIDSRLNEYAQCVRDGTKLQEVKCEERLVVETNEVQVVRLDTQEVVETRTADAADRQEALPLPKPEAESEPTPDAAEESADPDLAEGEIGA